MNLLIRGAVFSIMRLRKTKNICKGSLGTRDKALGAVYIRLAKEDC